MPACWARGVRQRAEHSAQGLTRCRVKVCDRTKEAEWWACRGPQAARPPGPGPWTAPAQQMLQFEPVVDLVGPPCVALLGRASKPCGLDRTRGPSVRVCVHEEHFGPWEPGRPHCGFRDACSRSLRSEGRVRGGLSASAMATSQAPLPLSSATPALLTALPLALAPRDCKRACAVTPAHSHAHAQRAPPAQRPRPARVRLPSPTLARTGPLSKSKPNHQHKVGGAIAVLAQPHHDGPGPGEGLPPFTAPPTKWPDPGVSP